MEQIDQQTEHETDADGFYSVPELPFKIKITGGPAAIGRALGEAALLIQQSKEERAAKAQRESEDETSSAE
ncbi:MAG: hypothetical protein R2867_19755 [Caldilineaceae bacterium]